MEIDHVGSQVGDDSLVRQRLHPDRLFGGQVGELRVAGEYLARVDPDAARAAGGVHAGMADDEGRIVTAPNRQQRVENRGARLDIELEGVEMGFAVALPGS